MDQDAVIRLAREALWMTLLVGGPVLLLTTVVGLAVSVFQALTQINEQALTFVPKIVATLAALALLGPWMLARLTAYASELIAGTAALGQ